MYRYALIRFVCKSACALVCIGFVSVYADEGDPSSLDGPEQVFSSPIYSLAQATGEEKQVQPPSGTLIFPDSYPKGQEDSSGKKCMTVCARWGEECTYVNRGTAGTTRNCRRSCQQFTEECF